MVLRGKLYTFGTNMKKARKKAGYTQEAFAEKINKSVESVKNWEQHRTIPEYDTLLVICDLLGCDLDYLFGRIENTTHDLKYICDNTGLSEAAAEILSDSQKRAKSTNYARDLNEWSFRSRLDTINTIVENDNIGYCIHRYLHTPASLENVDIAAEMDSTGQIESINGIRYLYMNSVKIDPALIQEATIHELRSMLDKIK